MLLVISIFCIIKQFCLHHIQLGIMTDLVTRVIGYKVEPPMPFWRDLRCIVATLQCIFHPPMPSYKQKLGQTCSLFFFSFWKSISVSIHKALFRGNSMIIIWSNYTKPQLYAWKRNADIRCNQCNQQTGMVKFRWKTNESQ